MHMKLVTKGALVLAAAALALSTAVLATSASATPRAAAGIKPIKVALVAPSATNDLAFTQSMYAALENLKASENLQIADTINVYEPSQYDSTIAGYASKGYNLVIAHGSQYGSTVESLAPTYKHTSFAWGTAGATFGLKNVFAYEAESNQGGYVQGYMGALLSKSKILGICGPIATGDAKLYVDGFQAGAKAAAAANHFKVTAHVAYTGSFSDTSAMATCAKSFIADGADVLTGSSQSVVGAIGVVKADNKLWFGTQSNQAVLAPHNVVSCQVYNWVPVLRSIFADLRSNPAILGDATYDIQVSNGGERIAFNSGYMLPASVKKQAEKLITEITDGTLNVPQ